VSYKSIACRGAKYIEAKATASIPIIPAIIRVFLSLLSLNSFSLLLLTDRTISMNYNIMLSTGDTGVNHVAGDGEKALCSRRIGTRQEGLKEGIPPFSKDK
jgi:hypothetical protein